jgi:hypothetical protein
VAVTAMALTMVRVSVVLVAATIPMVSEPAVVLLVTVSTLSERVVLTTVLQALAMIALRREVILVPASHRLANKRLRSPAITEKSSCLVTQSADWHVLFEDIAYKPAGQTRKYQVYNARLSKEISSHLCLVVAVLLH